MRGAAEHLALTAADFVAFQETKVPTKAAKDVETSTGNAGWKLSLEPCGYGDAGGLSAGTAVACRNHVGMDVACGDDIIPEELKGRFKLRVIGAVVKGVSTMGVATYTAHLESLQEPIWICCNP